MLCGADHVGGGCKRPGNRESRLWEKLELRRKTVITRDCHFPVGLSHLVNVEEKPSHKLWHSHTLCVLSGVSLPKIYVYTEPQNVALIGNREYLQM